MSVTGVLTFSLCYRSELMPMVIRRGMAAFVIALELQQSASAQLKLIH